MKTASSFDFYEFTANTLWSLLHVTGVGGLISSAANEMVRFKYFDLLASSCEE